MSGIIEELNGRNREIVEKYETVKIWVSKKCGSSETARNYIPNMIRFCKHYKTDPDEIVKKWKEVRYADWKEREKFLDEWSEKVEDYYVSLDLAPMSKLGKLGTIKSFFRSFKIPIDVQTNRHTYVKYHNRDIQRDELRRILDHSELRERVFFLMMAESGLRPSTLVQLKYRDIREDFESKTVPMKINVRPEIVKDRIAHRFSFIGEDGFNLLKEYLSTRDIKDDDYIFAKRRSKADNPCVLPESFSVLFAKVLRKLKFRDIETEYHKPKRLRLYCLRKYFRKNMRCPDTNFRRFWMCHTFGADEYYISRNVEEHRKQYSKGYKHLRIYEHNEQPTSETMWLLAKELDETKEKLSKFERIFNDGTLVVTKARLDELLSKGTSKGQILDMIVSERNEQL